MRYECSTPVTGHHQCIASNDSSSNDENVSADSETGLRSMGHKEGPRYLAALNWV
jgi:hypothetical protein